MGLSNCQVDTYMAIISHLAGYYHQYGVGTTHWECFWTCTWVSTVHLEHFWATTTYTYRGAKILYWVFYLLEMGLSCIAIKRKVKVYICNFINYYW